ncbi:MAG: 2-(1,2-epoxy-1,2-dihydrophenyl)acetyl-CoA isomerase PaaG [Gammaproteobacteria bacterium]|nr:2-(1,2-epoxy-1,2-dihydrophenyl)acetyl-CoA isomerase PaaG [Gammaproteobacteria bacterium]
MSYNTIVLERTGGHATLTLNRPDRLNSINREMHGELRDALREIRGDAAIRCLVLTGAGRGFCSGQDLAERVFPEGEAPDLGESLEKHYNPLIRTLRDLPVPVVVAVNGTAAGAGCSLALAGDIVLAARSALFIQSAGRLGLVPDAGGTWILPRLVGRARALGLAMLGEPLSAERAEAWGMIWQSVEDDRLLTETRELAADLATRPTRGLALIKRAFNASGANTLDGQLELERDLQRLAGRTADYREGVTAFMDKREPVFKGK